MAVTGTTAVRNNCAAGRTRCRPGTGLFIQTTTIPGTGCGEAQKSAERGAPGRPGRDGAVRTVPQPVAAFSARPYAGLPPGARPDAGGLSSPAAFSAT